MLGIDEAGPESPTFIINSQYVPIGQSRQAYQDWFDAHPNYRPENDPILSGEVRAGPMDLSVAHGFINTEYGMWKWDREVKEGRMGGPPGSDIVGAGMTAMAMALGGSNNSLGNQTPTGTYTAAEFQGRRIYQREINWALVDANGLTNVQRVQKGLASIGSDGREMVLHHVIQQEPGPMAEVLASVHERGHKILHGLQQAGESFRNNKALLNQYKRFQRAYWKWRGTQIGGQ